ncbi:cytoplasmic protein [Sistotremastrum niveocremeum HHB9708]|uniref:Cytoplasmic protein n=2 Tax=Sistotremastraceae TaxID=3402574 RepID=A0A164T2X5_9AGAM|nr:cytoplasmic protein [Sistotremastrum niveocremeum HHB9708]KZT32750.1 cytoplasmic protein [Sistotremastrum suecicum HHB10207 ss-3]
MATTSASAQRALATILPLINSDTPDYYSAHQKARTSASRLVKPPASKPPNYISAIEVLFETAKELLKKEQQGSGVDLGTFMIDLMQQHEEKVTDTARGRITQLIALVGSSGSWRKTLVDKAIAWSREAGSYPAGDPQIHHYIGEILYKEGLFEEAEPHFLASASRDSARTNGQMMAEWFLDAGSSESPPGPGAYAARGVLPYLVLGSVLAASAFISSFLSTLLARSQSVLAVPEPIALPDASSSSPSKEIFLTADQTLNFLQLAVRTCQRGQGDKSKLARESWIRLCGTYQSKGGLLTHPEVRRTLQELASLYFALPLPRAQPANPLGDMMAGLFGGMPGGGAEPQRKLAPPGLTGPTAELD